MCFNSSFNFNVLSIFKSGVKSEQKDNNGLMVIDHAVRKHKTSNFIFPVKINHEYKYFNYLIFK
jgi:hypothetical protein